MAKPSKSKSPRSKGRKLSSMVWNYFERVPLGNNDVKATCHGCKKSFVGSKGTSHLITHLMQRCSGGIISDMKLNHLDEAPTVVKGGTLMNSDKDKIMSIYEGKKEKFRRDINKFCCRLNLIVHEVWKGKNSWLCLIVYFIDDNWEFRKRIISFKEAPRELNLPAFIGSLLQDWILDKKLCSVFSSNFWQRQYPPEIRSWVSNRDPTFIITDHSSNDDFEDNRKRFERSNICSLLNKIKCISDYVLRTQKFDMTVEKPGFKSKKSDYKIGVLLENIVVFKDAFCKLEEVDPEFKSKALMQDEWGGVMAIFEFLEGLYDAASNLSSKRYTTTNVCFPKLCEQFKKFLAAEKSDNCYIRELCSTLKPAFLNFWKQSRLILTIAVMLDPRFKMDIIKNWFKELYDREADSHFGKFSKDVTDVFERYASYVSSSTSSKLLDLYGRPIDNVESSSSEFKRYLKDPKFFPVEEFDILAWWHVYAQSYPVLARMARDFLAAPISDFYFASAAESEMMKIVQDMPGVDPDVLEALICTNNHLKSPPNIAAKENQTVNQIGIANEKVHQIQVQPVNAKPFHDAFSAGLSSYIRDIKDVIGDGHCGFRAIANLMGFSRENGWIQVRKDLLYELISHSKLYSRLYESRERISTLSRILAADGKAGDDYWMTMPDMGYLIASCYEVVLFYLSSRECFTFLPLRSKPSPIDSRKEISLGLVNDNHFVEVYLSQSHPIPQIVPEWRTYREGCAEGWDVAYTLRIQQFENLNILRPPANESTIMILD